MMIMMTRALYNDKNIILRMKLTEKRMQTVVLQLARVISRGISEGLFQTGNPETIADLILSMAIPLRNKFAEYVLTNQLNEETRQRYLEMCEDYERSVERILGAPTGSLDLVDKDNIAEFFNYQSEGDRK
jgi:hypothetical protein